AASALAVGGMGRYVRRRQAAAERHHAGVRGAAAGTVRTGLPRLSQLPGLSAMESVAELFSDRSLLRPPPRRRAAHEQGQPEHPENHLRRDSRIATAFGKARL